MRMASTLVVETSVTNNSPSQDPNHPDYLFQSGYVTPGFKPFSFIWKKINRDLNWNNRKRFSYLCLTYQSCFNWCSAKYLIILFYYLYGPRCCFSQSFGSIHIFLLTCWMEYEQKPIIFQRTKLIATADEVNCHWPGGRERLYCFPIFAHHRLITTSVTSHSNGSKLRLAWLVYR